MTAKEESLSLEEVARLADGASISEATAAKLAALVRVCPLFEEQIAKLDAMAEAAGCGELEQALAAHRDFERLLSADWEHPSEALAGAMPYGRLISIATARADAAEGDEKERLVEIRDRLAGSGGSFVPKFGGGLLRVD